MAANSPWVRRGFLHRDGNPGARRGVRPLTWLHGCLLLLSRRRQGGGGCRADGERGLELPHPAAKPTAPGRRVLATGRSAALGSRPCGLAAVLRPRPAALASRPTVAGA